MILFRKRDTYLIVLLVSLFAAAAIVPRVSTKSAYHLTQKEIKVLDIKAEQGNYKAINRLHGYYFRSLHDSQKSIEFLRKYKNLKNFKLELINKLLETKNIEYYKEVIDIGLEDNNQTGFITYLSNYNYLNKNLLCEAVDEIKATKHSYQENKLNMILEICKTANIKI